jgi:hypothetical protein
LRSVAIPECGRELILALVRAGEEASFDNKFLSKLRECGVPDEEKSKLFLMRHSLKNASGAIA